MASDDGRSSHTGQLSDYPEPNTPKDMVEEPYWTPSKTSYQLWLCPAPMGGIGTKITSAIGGCAEKHQTPHFAPHVSIWSFSSPIQPDTDQEVLMVRTLTALTEMPEGIALRNVDLKFGPMQVFDTWNQNVISVADDVSNELLGALNLKSQILFPKHSLEFIPSDEPDFQPPAKRAHLSYAYGEQDMPERERMLEWFRSNHADVARGITIPSKGAYFSLVRTAGGKKSVWEAGISAVECWQQVARVPLNPSDTTGDSATGSALNLGVMMAQAGNQESDDDNASIKSVDEAGALDGL